MAVLSGHDTTAGDVVSHRIKYVLFGRLDYPRGVRDVIVRDSSHLVGRLGLIELLRQAGHSIRLCKALQVKHLKRWGFLSLLRSDFVHRALPWTELILREQRLINDLNLQYSSRASVVLVYCLLAFLLSALYWPASLLLAGAAGISLLVLNARLYGFFLGQRGLWFTLRSIAWHWFYYLYSGLAFLIGAARHLLGRRTSSEQCLQEPDTPRPWTGHGPDRS